jgi:energy-coupling factor transporter ATP-binding protein EcfA2
MQINSIETKNFKNLTINTSLSKVNIILGSNGTGKSTFLNAIRYAITGKKPSDMAKLGTATGFAIADIKDVGKIQRGWTASGSKTALNGKTTNATSISESIKELCGANSDVASVMTSSELLAGMSAGDVSKFFIDQGFLKLNADIDKIIAYSPKLSEGAQNELRMYFPIAPETISIEEIKVAYQYYYDARRTVKKDIDAVKSLAAYCGAKPNASAVEIVAKRDGIAQLYGQKKAELESYKSLKAAYDRFATTIRALQEKADAITVLEPVPNAIEDVIAKMADTQMQKSEKERTAGVLKNTDERLKKLLARLGEPICPKSEKLVCTTDKTAVSSEIQSGIDEALKELAVLQQQIKALSESYASFESEKTAIAQNAVKYQEKQGYLVQIKKMQNDMPKEPAVPDATNIEVLQNNLDALNIEYNNAIKYEEAEKAAVKLNQLTDRLSIYEELVDAMNPKNGITQKVLERSVIPLEEYCNREIASILPKYTVKFDVSDGMRILLQNQNEQTISYESASRGEKIRIRFLVLNMLNALSGFRLLMIDDLDSLDKESLAALLALIDSEKVKNEYDHIFLCGVDHAEVREAVENMSTTDCKIIRL